VSSGRPAVPGGRVAVSVAVGRVCVFSVLAFSHRAPSAPTSTTTTPCA